MTDRVLPTAPRKPRVQITFDDAEDTASAARPGPSAPVTAAGAPPPPAVPPVPVPAVAWSGAVLAAAPASPSPMAIAAMSMNRKSPGAAVLLSLLFTGAGQIYCGRAGRGIAFFCGAVVSAVLCLAVIGFILLPIVIIWAAVDASNLANSQNATLLAATAGR